jgi:RNA polymerase-binding transcription factor DksA
MADEADIASAYIEAIESELYKRQRNAEVQVKEGARFCKSCDETMPSARRQLGFQLCIECAEETERRKALFGNKFNIEGYV